MASTCWWLRSHKLTLLSPCAVWSLFCRYHGLASPSALVPPLLSQPPFSSSFPACSAWHCLRSSAPAELLHKDANRGWGRQRVTHLLLEGHSQCQLLCCSVCGAGGQQGVSVGLWVWCHTAGGLGGGSRGSSWQYARVWRAVCPAAGLHWA